MITDRAELVRKSLFAQKIDLVASFIDGDLQALDVSVMSPDVEVRFIARAEASMEYRGIDGLIEGWREWLEPWATYTVEVEDQVEVGDRVIVLVLLQGETKHGGVHMEQPAAVVVSVEEGKITRLEFHLYREKAFESARTASG